MLGGTDNALFFQAFGGFLVLPLFVLLAWWTVGSKNDPHIKRKRNWVKNSLNPLRRDKKKTKWR